jgi:hypothetical protein
MLRTSVALLVLLPICLLAQKSDDVTKGRKIILHVTSVRHEEDSTVCGSGECSATKFTVEGYANGVQPGSRIAYVLTCDEYLADKPTPHISMACVRVHANGDYDGKLFGDSISLWPEEKYTPPPYEAVYSIVSEKEVRKP